MTPKVGLCTTWNERCGVATYAYNLVKNCPGVEFKILDRQVTQNFDPIATVAAARDCDILHLTYEPGLMSQWNSAIAAWAKVALGHKMVVSWYVTSGPGERQNSFTAQFDAVIVHENTGEAAWHVIPHGILEIPDLAAEPYEHFPPKIGTVGFPFPWKGFDTLAEVCERAGVGMLAIIPVSGHGDAEAYKRCVLDRCPKAEVVTDWLEEDEVVRRLSKCWATAFPYRCDNAGISGASRLGIAARRPVILSRSRMFNDLFAYEDELIFTPPTTDAVCDAIVRITSGEEKRKPQRVLEELGWSKTGPMYADVYRSVLG